MFKDETALRGQDPLDLLSKRQEPFHVFFLVRVTVLFLKWDA